MNEIDYISVSEIFMVVSGEKRFRGKNLKYTLVFFVIIKHNLIVNQFSILNY